MRALSLLPLAAAALACRTATIVNSIPQGATVEIEGVTGVTPFTVDLPITTFGSYTFRAEREGYEVCEGELEKDLNVTGIAISLVFPPALLGTVFRATTFTTIELTPQREFPGGFTVEEPWRIILPPLPPGMESPATQKSSTASAPAEGR